MSQQPPLPDAAPHAVVEARIETLELKLMDLENTLSELNDVILRQYRDIERMQLQHVELISRLPGSTDDPAVALPTARDEVPPHY
jgi:uncharacterized coiled-coil protein SlyX